MSPEARAASRAARGLCLALTALLTSTPAGAGVRPLSLFQKTARASLVVRARATSDSTRRPSLEVLDVIKGSYPQKTLTIVPFLQDNTNPKPWLQREEFKKGEVYYLFLKPFDPNTDDDAFESGRDRAPRGEKSDRLFVSLNANQGVLPVPVEGGTAIEEALRRFASILASVQYDQQAKSLRALLGESNPYLVEAGLGETERFHLAEPEDVPALLVLTDSHRVDFRAAAIRILGDLAERIRNGGGTIPRREETIEKVTGRAQSDRDEDVRRDAVVALAQLGGEHVAPVLRAIAEKDSSQSVRYAAGVALLGMSEGRQKSGDGPR